LYDTVAVDPTGTVMLTFAEPPAGIADQVLCAAYFLSMDFTGSSGSCSELFDSEHHSK